MSDITRTTRQPRLSDLGMDLLHLTKWQVARAIAMPFFAFAAFWILACSQHWIPAVVSLVILSFVTYGSTSHDLVHGSLGLKRLPNDVLLAVIEAISLRSGHAYQMSHLNHHARFPHDDDIEADAARMSLARALLEGVVFQFRIYAWALRHPRGRRNWIVGEGIAVAAIVLGAIAALPWTIIPAVYADLMIAGSWTIPLVTFVRATRRGSIGYFAPDACLSRAACQNRRIRSSLSLRASSLSGGSTSELAATRAMPGPLV
jgi:beta-carotene hydroxylase